MSNAFIKKKKKIEKYYLLKFLLSVLCVQNGIWYFQWNDHTEMLLMEHNILALRKKTNLYLYANLAKSTFRVDRFLEGTWYEGKQTGSQKRCLPCKKWQKSTKFIQSSYMS